MNLNSRGKFVVAAIDNFEVARRTESISKKTMDLLLLTQSPYWKLLFQMDISCLFYRDLQDNAIFCLKMFTSKHVLLLKNTKNVVTNFVFIESSSSVRCWYVKNSLFFINKRAFSTKRDDIWINPPFFQ